jgi:hypothetical protein
MQLYSHLSSTSVISKELAVGCVFDVSTSFALTMRGRCGMNGSQCCIVDNVYYAIC